MLLSSIPTLPPPPSSLLPSFNPQAAAASNMNGSHYHHDHGHPHHHHHLHPHHHQSRRHKHTQHPRSTLALLNADERMIHQRKMAIAMFGYSWLKPAGCAKTMLGRREEEIEREEVERMAREVEVQERIALEQEEAARLAALNTTGEPVEGRDLDAEIPDADAAADNTNIDNTQEVDLDAQVPEADAEVDLDDDIPDADDNAGSSDDEDSADFDNDDTGPVDEGWSYDTRREPDTPEEAALIAARQQQFMREMQMQQRARAADAATRNRMRRGSPDFGMDERDAEALALAEEMLEEDELGEDIVGAERDLDEDVPDADEGEWEHTDSDTEDSEMDISVLPAGGGGGGGQGRGSVGARVVSGNAAHGLGLPIGAGSASQRSAEGRELATGRRQENYETPLGVSGSAEQRGTVVGGSDVPPTTQSTERRGRGQRWLNAASARRNLFGIGRGNGSGSGSGSGRGGLFTPSPAQSQSQSQTPEAAGENEGAVAGSQSQPRRSGRLLGIGGRRRRGNGDGVDE